jgi:flagellar protein FliO/FliZ
MIPDLLQLTLALLVVLACVFGAAWLLQSFRRSHLGRRNSIHIESSVSLGSRERVVVVDVGGQRLLLGVAQGSVRTLAQLPAVAVATGTDRLTQTPAPTWLSTYLGKLHDR